MKNKIHTTEVSREVFEAAQKAPTNAAAMGICHEIEEIIFTGGFDYADWKEKEKEVTFYDRGVSGKTSHHYKFIVR